MKNCRTCGECLCLDKFNKSRAAKDGVQSSCRQCQKAVAAGWREQNPDAKQAYARAYYQGHTEQRRMYSRNFYARNPGYYAAKHSARRAKLAGNGGSHTAADWNQLCARYDFRCVACGRSGVALERDHIVAVTKGGSDNIDNLQPLCGSCNRRKHTQHRDYREDARCRI